jgi:hypothetical protein
MPVIETLVHPLNCSEEDGLMLVDGFGSVLCHSGTHNFVTFCSILGALFIIPYGLLMSLIYFEPSPKSKSGKSSGHFDFMYMLFRIGIIIVNTFLKIKTSVVLNAILLFLLLVLFALNQPFYSHKMNNMRFALICSAWVVSLCSIAKAFDFSLDTTTYIISTLVIGFAIIPAGYFINDQLVKLISYSLYRALENERFLNKEKFVNLSFHMSRVQLGNIDPFQLINLTARDEQCSVFPLPGWVEICSRFIRQSYMNEKSNVFAMEIFDTGFRQFPKSSHVHIMYLEYIDAYFRGMTRYKVTILNNMQRKCSYVSFSHAHSQDQFS